MLSYNKTNDVAVSAVARTEPAKVRRFPEEGRIQVRKGDTVTLRCLGEGNPFPTIRWSKPVKKKKNNFKTPICQTKFPPNGIKF